MKFSEAWLREWVDPPVTTNDLLEQLTQAGLEVESCEPAAGQFSQVVVGEVIAIKPHPDAKKLNVCEVHVADEAPLTIVCGAANVTEGMKVPTALVGASLPNGLTIQLTQLRGVESHGMLCSAQELGLAESSDGLYQLPQEAPVGQDLRNYLQLDDQIIDLAITPNRGDCLSLSGVAREVAALNELASVESQNYSINPVDSEQLEISLQAGEACPRYLGRVIRGIDSSVTTPARMQERLRRSGVKAISLVVDCLNYVMLELGQPMHAFDLSRLTGGLEVRWAKEGESLTLLNENTVQLTGKTLIIADQQSPQAIAGVMGGLYSSVTDQTQDIFLESAFFSPQAIAGCAKQYGLSTDSSYRFERGVDFNLPFQAIEKATQLILELAGGQAGPISCSEDKETLPQPKTIELSITHLNSVLNLQLTSDEVQVILEKLELEVQPTTHNYLLVQVPSHRFDLSIEQDLFEEVARIYGYNRIPVSNQQSSFAPKFPSAQQLPELRLKTILKDLGYHEAITYSFVSPDMQKLLEPEQPAITLENPISEEMSVMRTSLWSGLLNAVKHNQDRQQARIRLFEIGRCFHPQQQKIDQDIKLAGVITGTRLPEQWSADSKLSVDFFDLKGDIEHLLAEAGISSHCQFHSAEHTALHPGQCACLIHQGEEVGYLGALHPELQQQLEIKKRVYLFELSLSQISWINPVVFQEVSKFPAVRRDFAFLVDDSVPTQCLTTGIKQVLGELVVDITVFDVFTGKELAKNKRSVAIGVTLQHVSRTLTDDEIAELSNQVVTALRSNYGAELRE